MTLLLLFLGCGGEPASDHLGGSAGVPVESADRTKSKLELGTAGGVDPNGEIHGELLSSTDCDTITSDSLPADGCLTGKLRCGETVVGNTKGGVNRFDTRFYEQHFCTPATTDHNDGGERVYELVMPEGEWHADITLETPCADLDLAAMKWDGEGCPDKTSRIDICELNRQTRNKPERVRIVSQGPPTRWLVVVEGEGVAEGAFGIKVVCAAGL